MSAVLGAMWRLELARLIRKELAGYRITPKGTEIAATLRDRSSGVRFSLMLEEIIVTTEDRPGVLAEIGELLGDSGVNIETLSASTHNGEGVIHLVVDDGDHAGGVLTSNGYNVEAARPVLTVTLDDRPGELGRYCRRLAQAGVGITSAYVAKRGGGETEVIFSVDDLETATYAHE